MAAALTFWGAVARRAAATPDRACLVDDEGRRLTFGGLRDEAERLAAGLHGLGVRAGTAVAWQLPTGIDTVVLSVALARLGAVQVPIIPIYREREVAAILAETAPDLFVVPGTWRGRDYAAEAATYPMKSRRLADLPRADPAGLPAASPDGTAVRWVYYTSGTTGVQKGARHTDASVLAAARNLVACLDLGPDDVGTLVFPYAHVGGGFLLMSAVLAGHRLACVPHFTGRSVDLLRREGVTYPGAGLAFHQVYLAAQRERPDEPLFPRVRGFTHGGDPRRHDMHEALRREIGGVGILSTYGMTEFPMIASGAAGDPAGKLATRIGRPCAGVDLRVVRADGTACGPGEEGEIRVRGDALCAGYVDGSLDFLDADGYFRTGDLGVLDADGYLEVTGRLKDIIVRKGEKVGAGEVEHLLRGHPEVADVAVVGLPDPEVGERCCAVVVPRDAGRPPGLDALTGYLSGRGLMAHKLPERLEVRLALPKDFFGKVRKAQLRAELAGDTATRLAWSYFQRLNEGRLDEAADLLDDEGTWWTCGSRRELPMATHKRLFPAALRAAPMRFVLRGAVERGDQVVLELESHADLPDGAAYHNVYAFVVTVRSGRLWQVREYFDTAHLAAVAPSLKRAYGNSTRPAGDGS
ncbi:AMP-binding protein [Phytohabitans sp. ZYX-F-186]|uniref:AMP-binding protein n=1 Tax=Phytohabitans maris TaxID=3071409 RepID=A0ABU0Z9K2_9ACTN|nr:AMP-binding protein [Phytohabitans sp. ZYX-F-186]MDQ7903732.1 AMP-binding protein [Phytohabitans sp. ZYX-F-186]